VLKLFDYLQALKRLSAPMAYDLADYGDLLWWEADLPSADGCFLYRQTAKHPGAWLEIHKQLIPPSPSVPELLEQWVEQPGRDPEKPPTYKAFLGTLSEEEQKELERLPKAIERLEEELAGLVKAEDRAVLERKIALAYARWEELEQRQGERFENSPERVAAWEAWLRDKWRPWAEGVIPRMKVQRLYGQLFSLYQRLERESEIIELVWGHGLLVWRWDGYRIRRPLLVTRMELVFDAAAGVFSLLPAEPGTVLETDMLPPSLPNLTKVAEWERRVREEGVDPQDNVSMEALLTELVHLLDPDGRCEMREKVSNPTNFSRVPVIYNAPVIFVRKRGGTLWQRELQGVMGAILQGIPIPKPLAAVVSPVKEQFGDTMAHAWQRVGEDLLFPLPANEEQKEIARRLAQHFGVVVQGPPGTGKSHTIVNLLCHLLAHGKRVLVTSHTERALRVLGDKIKTDLPQLAPLCVSVLGGDARSTQELEDAVSVIKENLAIEPERRRPKVERLREGLATCRQEIASLWYRLRQAAHREHSPVEIDGRSMQPSEFARWLAQHEKEYGWLPDELAWDSVPPLSEDEMLRLFELQGLLRAEDLAAVRLNRPKVSALPDASTFERRIEELKECEQVLASLQGYLPGFTQVSEMEADVLPNLICQAEEALRRLDEFREPWMQRMLDEVSRGGVRKAMWAEFVRECRTYIEKLFDLNRRLAKHIVALPTGVPLPELKEALLTLREQMNKGKLGWWFRHVSGRQVSRLLEETYIDRAPVREASHVDLLLLEVDRRETVESLVTLWNNTMADVEGPVLDQSPPGRLAAVAEDLLDTIDAALQWTELCAPLAESAKRYLGSVRRVIPDSKWLTEVLQSLRAIYAKAQLDRLLNYFSRIRNYLTNYGGAAVPGETPHASWMELVHALDNRDAARWKSILDELQRLEALEPLFDERDALLARLGRVAPQWAALISTLGGQGEPFLPPEGWQLAWTWKRAETWLRQLQRECNTEEIEAKLEAARRREAWLMAELVAEEAWLRQVDRVRDNESQRRSLEAWAQEMKKIGKGTGRYADWHRREARRYMQEARGAVPVWIMPVYRVLENFPPGTERFDVVIVDESSQSDLFALSILFRAEKAVIVGDSNQISPEAVGIEQSQVHELMDRYLQGIPQATRFDLQASLYDIAEIAFPVHLMLKEHFRSVPMIINFSNNLMYGGEIHPLRVPKRSEILDPPVVAVRVPDGYREPGTRAINEPEARALVAKAAELCRRPEYAGKTMGVISLQGEDQARLIEELLREELGEVEMLNRKLVCGDAYAFQGDERDVIFMSMVAAPNVRIGALTKRSDMQRFNVAASRARDQMWLFYSVDLEDLNPNCMRAHLLRYFLDPARLVSEDADGKDPFESDFERDVYRLIVARGYVVKPQVRVGTPGKGYRIDLVVEGLHSRLAVECDGDKWHGIERWEEDRQRQTVLERVGWRFWRIRASTFYRNPQKAMEPLWRILEEMGIEPATCPPGQRRFQIVS